MLARGFACSRQWTASWWLIIALSFWSNYRHSLGMGRKSTSMPCTSLAGKLSSFSKTPSFDLSSISSRVICIFQNKMRWLAWQPRFTIYLRTPKHKTTTNDNGRGICTSPMSHYDRSILITALNALSLPSNKASKLQQLQTSFCTNENHVLRSSRHVKDALTSRLYKNTHVGTFLHL